MPTEDLHRVTLPKDLNERVKSYADATGLSESEVIRNAMDDFEAGKHVEPKPERITKTIYIKPGEYGAFTRKARASHITIRYALELALEDYLQ